jgi:O-antigen ligase
MKIRFAFLVVSFFAALVACGFEKNEPGIWTVVFGLLFFFALLLNWGEADER